MICLGSQLYQSEPGFKSQRLSALENIKASPLPRDLYLLMVIPLSSLRAHGVLRDGIAQCPTRATGTAKSQITK